MMTCGELVNVRPSLGAWSVYGLGTENQNLPAFVALSPSGSTASGDKHWGNGFLPAWSRGTSIADKKFRGEQAHRAPAQRQHLVARAAPPARSPREMNREHLGQHPGDAFLEGRILSFETAFRMQVEAADAFDLSREPTAMRISTATPSKAASSCSRGGSSSAMSASCRSGTEAGTRTIKNDERPPRTSASPRISRSPRLLADLKQRDMLKDTLVIWAGEFGAHANERQQ